MKKILLIDGQGGKMGRQLAEMIISEFPGAELIAVGTNSIATAAMLKAGVKLVATGENAVIVNSRSADVIVGPIGIVIADSMLGEITTNMALAVSQSQAAKILIPSGKCNNLVAGVTGMSVSAMLSDAIYKLHELLD